MLSTAELVARANAVAAEPLGRFDHTPPELVGAEVRLNGKRFRVLSANTSNAKYWGRVVWLKNPTLYGHTSGAVRLTKRGAAEALKGRQGFLCALTLLS